MTRDDPMPLTPDERRAQDAARGLPAPQADPAFRARLRQDFVSGRIGERRGLALAAPRRVAWLRWAAVPAAALALAAGVVANQAPPWRVVASEGDGVVSLDGSPVDLAARGAIERGLRPGARVRLPVGASLTLASAGRLVMELTPGTEMTLPRVPGRWLGRSVRAEMARGEVHVATGRGFHGARLAIETAEARLEVTGTTLAVLCLPEGTCVCVYEGVVRVGPKRGEMVAVPAGRRREVFNDGRPVLDDAILAHEHDNLGRLMARRPELLR